MKKKNFLIIIILLLLAIFSFYYLYYAKQRALNLTAERIVPEEEQVKQTYQEISDLEKKLAENPSDLESWRLLSLKYKKVGDLAHSRDAMIKVTELDPKDYLAFSVLGDIYYEMKDNVVAEQSYKKAISRKPDYSNSYIKLIDLYRFTDIGSKEKLEAVYLDGIKNTNDSLLMKFYAGFLTDNTRYQESIDYWKEAQKQELTNTAINEEIANLEILIEQEKQNKN